MWTQSNERFLDRDGCGDELYLDADRRALAWLAGLQGERHDDFDELDDGADDAAAH